MDETTYPSSAAAIAEVPSHRGCTRCDGEQHLVGGAVGLGKYRCDTCGIVVGYDLESEPAEFLLDRGAPSLYSKELYGSRLLPSEQRLR